MELKILSLMLLVVLAPKTCYGQAQQQDKAESRSFGVGYGGPLVGGFGSIYGQGNSYSSSASSTYNHGFNGYGAHVGYGGYPGYGIYPGYGGYGVLGGYGGYNSGYSGYHSGYSGFNSGYGGYGGYHGYGGLYG